MGLSSAASRPLRFGIMCPSSGLSEFARQCIDQICRDSLAEPVLLILEETQPKPSSSERLSGVSDAATTQYGHKPRPNAEKPRLANHLPRLLSAPPNAWLRSRSHQKLRINEKCLAFTSVQLPPGYASAASVMQTTKAAIESRVSELGRKALGVCTGWGSLPGLSYELDALGARVDVKALTARKSDQRHARRLGQCDGE